MKTTKISLSTILLLAISSFTFSQQCPPSVFKIQSPICDTPSNLNITNIKCTTVRLNWQGNKEQKYIVTASGTDNAGKTLLETDSASYSCNESGSCNATINVKEGATLNWNVQAICNINSVIIYSPKIEGKEVVIPDCNPIAANAKTNNNTNLRVYPNPTTSNLYVEYHSHISGSVKLKVIDVNGKAIFTTSGNARTGNNTYDLNLRNLSPGTYLLELSCNGNVNNVKFVLAGK